MKRPPAPTYLTRGFRYFGLESFRHGEAGSTGSELRMYDGGPACWLFQHDPLERPCSGQLEVIHLIGRQRVRNMLHPQIARLDFPDTLLAEEVEEIVAQAEWDDRNARPGCEGHHRRVDGQLTPALLIPAEALDCRFFDFVTQFGLEAEAERKFVGCPPLVGADADHREGTASEEASPAGFGVSASDRLMASPPRQAGITPPAPGVVGGVGSGESALINNTTERSTR